MKGMKKKSYSDRTHHGKLPIVRSLVSATLICTLMSCGHLEEHMELEDTTLTFTLDGLPATKSLDPDENLVSDINIFIFNEADQLEESLYFKAKELPLANGGLGCRVSLLRNCRYSIYACANIGKPMGIRSMKELIGYKFHLVYEDDYIIGIPMAGSRKHVTVTGQKEIQIPLERTMAKVSVCIDRSRLYADIRFMVRSIRVGGCPRNVLLFSKSKITSPDDAFIVGFMKDNLAAEPLNTTAWERKSQNVSLYILENMHGDQLYGASSDKDKFFDEGDPRTEICSYIELRIEYLSATQYTKPGKALVYRFYLGDNERNFDVRRNTHYHITVTPEGDGLQGSGWRVDKSAVTQV